MNINALNSYNQNFKEKFKMSPRNEEVLRRAATAITGTAACAYGVESYVSVAQEYGHLNSMVESLPDKLVESHNGVLTSAAENGWPVQSISAPATLVTTGAGFLNDGLTGKDSGKIFFS